MRKPTNSNRFKRAGQPEAGSLLYVDPYPGGHHGDYLAFFMEVCARLGLVLHVQAPASVWARAAALAPAASAAALLDRDLDLSRAGKTKRAAYVFGLAKAQKRVGASLVFFPTIDSFVGLLAASRLFRGYACGSGWGGIFFVDELETPSWGAVGYLQRARIRARSALLNYVLGAPDCTGACTLNPLPRRTTKRAVTWLPDALSHLDKLIAAETHDAGIWPAAPLARRSNGRLQMLLFGSMLPRKGILQLCEALRDTHPRLTHRVAIKLYGEFADPGYEAQVRRAAAAAREAGVEIELNAEFLSDVDLDRELRNADIVLAPYLDHISSSGVVGLAAQYGRPVITQDSFQIGKEVRRHNLGWTCRTTSRSALAACLVQAVETYASFDFGGMDEYRRQRNYGAALQTGSGFLKSALASAMVRARRL